MHQILLAFSFQFGSYISDLGGVLGLWMGFSILTVFEFLEVALDLIMRRTLRSSGKRDENGRNINMRQQSNS